MQTVGTGTRILHFLVDTALVFLLAYTAYKTWNWYVYYWHYTYFSFFWFFWAVLFVYYFLWEVFANRTPAKWISATKVCTRNGNRPGVGQIFIRSLVRLIPIDMFFIPFLQGPLHDYLSGTTLKEV